MPYGELASDRVGVLLREAVRAGLAVGWVGLGARAGVRGRCWCTGVSGLRGGATEADLRFDLASLTKPLATTTLLLLARRDGLDLDTPISDLLPELVGTPWGDVTFLQCATHTAGFPAWAPLYALGSVTREGYLVTLGGVAPAATPGSRVEYSCLGYIAVGIALERGGGADLATLFKEMVAEPLGVAEEIGFAPGTDTPVAAGEADWLVEANLLAGRGLAAAPPPTQEGLAPCDDGNSRGLGGIAGNAGLFGTAAAVARVAAEYLPGGGEILGAEEAELATRCFTEGLEQARGLGWQLASTPLCSAGPALSAGAFGHTGFTGTSVWADPESEGVFVLLGNRLHPGGRTPDLHPMRRRFHRLCTGTLGSRAEADAGQ